MNHMKKLVLVTAVLALTHCVIAAGEKPLTLTVADKGKTVTAKVGQAITVLLKGNPTTGYSWDWAGVIGDAVAKDGDVAYATDKHPPGMVGVGGMFTAKLKAVKPGKSTVRLEYRRPWEKDVKPQEDDIFTVTVSVEK
jgi:inhibitor of cysteine peptidase